MIQVVKIAEIAIFVHGSLRVKVAVCAVIFADSPSCGLVSVGLKPRRDGYCMISKNHCVRGRRMLAKLSVLASPRQGRWRLDVGLNAAVRFSDDRHTYYFPRNRN